MDVTRASRGWTVAWVVVGIAAFLTPQVVLLLTTAQSPLSIEDPGWFLNSGRNVATISGVIATVAALLAARRRWRIQDTATFGAGVQLAMVGTLSSRPDRSFQSSSSLVLSGSCDTGGPAKAGHFVLRQVED